MKMLIVRTLLMAFMLLVIVPACDKNKSMHESDNTDVPIVTFTRSLLPSYVIVENQLANLTGIPEMSLVQRGKIAAEAADLLNTHLPITLDRSFTIPAIPGRNDSCEMRYETLVDIRHAGKFIREVVLPVYLAEQLDTLNIPHLTFSCITDSTCIPDTTSRTFYACIAALEYMAEACCISFETDIRGTEQLLACKICDYSQSTLNMQTEYGTVILRASVTYNISESLPQDSVTS